MFMYVSVHGFHMVQNSRYDSTKCFGGTVWSDFTGTGSAWQRRLQGHAEEESKTGSQARRAAGGGGGS